MKIILDNFQLEEFNRENNEHREVLEKLNKDQGVKRYLGDINYSIERINKRYCENRFNKAFIPYYNEYPIGYISLSYIDDEYQISCGILNEFRKENLASLLLEEFSDYLLNNYEEIDKLTAKIESDNIGSIKAASLASYSEEDRNKYIRRR